MAESFRITDHNRLSQIRTKVFQYRDKAVCDGRAIHALDTETDQNGDILVICDEMDNYLDKITPESLFSWLFSKRYQGTWNFFYYLDFDARVILKTLGEILYDYKKTRRLQWKFHDYSIQYIPFKKLTIMKGHKSAVFFDIKQFYEGTLIEAYQKNIKKKLSKEYLGTKNKRDSFSKEHYRINRRQIRDYCIQDCILTKELAEHFIKLFEKSWDFYPQRWISPGYLAEKVLLNHDIFIPRFEETPLPVQELAWSSYRAGRFEILYRGFIGKTYLYDINSAYPSTFSKIPDITNKTGRWIKSKKIHPDALLGFFKIKAKVPYDKFVPPFWYVKYHRMMFPVGTFTTFATLQELQSVDPDYYEILESFQYADKSPHYPYREFIQNAFHTRQKLKEDDDPLQLPLKVILNCIYGKTAQRIGNRIGNLYNPVICATITGHARAILYDFVMKNGLEKDVVSFATDSILTTKKLDVNSTELGGWKFEKSANDTFVVQNGINRMNDQWKKRGIFSYKGKKFEQLDTEAIDGNIYMIYEEKKPNTLKASINSGKINQIGRFDVRKRKINLNADQKRYWSGQRLKSINDRIMNVSVPWNLDMI